MRSDSQPERIGPGLPAPPCGDQRSASERRRLLNLLPALALIVIAFVSRVAEAKPPLVLQGRLLSVPGSGPILRTRGPDGSGRGKDISLAGRTSYLFHTLQDKRLLDREVRLEGTSRPDGGFEVERLYTVHDGKLYRIRYFCEVCNIEALEPGDCVCCQKPTELQEIPVSETDKGVGTTQ